jgi:GAF domain-containing protein
MNGAQPANGWSVAEADELLRFWNAIDQLIDLEQIAYLTLDVARRVGGAEAARLSLVEFSTRRLHPCWNVSDHVLGDKVREALDRFSLEVSRDREAVRRKIAAARGQSQFFLCVPVFAQNMWLGSLAITSAQAAFTARDERFLRQLAAEAGSAILRVRRFEALRHISLATAAFSRTQRDLEQVFHALHQRGFEFATISAVDRYRGIIETVRGMNVPPEWIKRAWHRLDSGDIQAQVFRTKQHVVIEGADDRLDPDIFKRFRHETLVRIWMPVISEGDVVGTIEAGCDRSRKDDVFTPDVVSAVRAIADEHTATLANARPHVLLTLITKHAIEVLGAESGSLHVYKDKDPFLVAGAGKADIAFLQQFAPRPDGIGQRAIAASHVRTATADELAANHPDLFRAGVRAMMAVPLPLEKPLNGVLYIHFWDPHTFVVPERETAKLLARHLEMAIQSSQAMRNIVDLHEQAWTFSRFQNVIQEVASSGDPREVLEKIGDYVLFAFGADNVTLYQYFQAEYRFEFPPVMPGSFRDENSMLTQIRPDDIVWRAVKQDEPIFSDDVRGNPALCGARTDGTDKPRFVEREGIRSSAILALRSDAESVGVMFVNYRSEHRFDEEEKLAMSALASSAAIAIKSARLRTSADRQARRRLDALHAIKAVLDKVALQKGDVEEQVVELFLLKAVEIVGAPVGVVMWYSHSRRRLESRAMRGFPPEYPTIHQHLDQGVVGRAAQTRQSVLVSDVKEAQWEPTYRLIVPETRSELAVPITDETGLLGVLNVEHPQPGKFTQEDQALLEALAAQAASAIHSARLYARLERQIQPLQFLGLIATRLRGDLDARLRLLLTGITAKQGLGFSRAMVFLLDPTARQLEGRIAVGAMDGHEANRVWTSVEKLEREFFGQGAHISRALLDLVDERSNDIRLSRVPDSPFSTLVRGLSIPFSDAGGAVAQCVREHRTVIVRPGTGDLLRAKLREESAQRFFACVPVWNDDHPIGALVVDNAFFVTEGTLNDEAIANVDAFAEIAGMTVAQFRLQSLEQWRPFMQRTGQLFGSHIAMINALVRKLRTSLSGQQFAELTSGVAEMQRLLTDFRRFSKEDSPPFERLDLRQVVKSTVGALKASIGVPIECTIGGDALFVHGDARMLGDAIAELIENSEEAMVHAHTPNKIIKVRAELKQSAGDRSMAQLEVSDTGPGIAETNKETIFQPLFTTKEHGTGLGLMTVWDIIEQHHGLIAETGFEGRGAQFRIQLPLV